ncbi:NADH:ubiquinone oxidoreductase subunit J [Brachybacterium sp. P6-10-X1]|uniref:NADH-quinone oxidoreductase subunit J n=1 Tax=Brachybacterium sp. P6-10-X1 TaxID=1903186 RepID=UPI000971846A|nr:NADH-quinone oxidoreductase subunit J [Brachybacterium sp. P6-10-X1]APX31837.1 NADH:ubiquinone oxidoreductase subunit J [Brachybacterium sp. P6-10-X1]
MLIAIVFWVLAIVAVTAGVAVFVVDSMARATYALALSFIAVGVVILLLQQSYLGLITILMMVMEMAVMAVYMVMFMGMNPALMPMDMTHGKKTAIGTSVGVFVLLAGGALLIPWPQRRGEPPENLTHALGLEIMGEKMLVMAVVAPVMVATIVAGVVLAAHRTRYDRFGDDLRHRPADDPRSDGVGQ